MSDEIRKIFSPYCVIKQPDGRYMITNRKYKPLGNAFNEFVDYALHSVKIKGLTKTVAGKISFNNNQDTDRIYLYNDECNPSRSEKHMQDYLQRLSVLLKLTLE